MKKNIIYIAFLCSFISNAQTVSTFVGSTLGYVDGTGTAAQFSNPAHLCFDSSNNLYVADTYNHKIRKITPAGVVTTFAGSTLGFANGTGIAAQFAHPLSVCIDSNDNVYVADSENDKIRKITPAGVVTTFSDGTNSYVGFNNPCGVCTDSSNNIYVTDSGNSKICKITPTGVVTILAGSTEGFADGIGTAAQFDNPNGICIDINDNVYVADTNNSKIRKITPVGVVTTLAGSSSGFADGIGASAQFYYPNGICTDVSGNVYVADTANSKIRKITPAAVVTTLAGSTFGFADGIGTTAKFKEPMGVCTDVNGNVYVADWNNHKIRIITQTLDVNQHTKDALGLTIYPNPTTNVLNIKLEEINTNTQLQITDILGKTICSQKIEDTITTINTTSFIKGIYFLTITDNNKKITQKFIVE